MRLTMDPEALAPRDNRTWRVCFAGFPLLLGKRAACWSILLFAPLCAGLASTPPRPSGPLALSGAAAEPVATSARAHHSGNQPSPGNAASSGRDAEAAIEDDAYRSSAKDLTLNLDGERKAEAAAHFMHGLMLEDSSDADKALDENLKALALDPANVDLSIKLAWEYLTRGDTPAAINLLKDTVKAAPKQAEPSLALAYLYLNTLNKVDLAQKYATQALEIDPTNIYCYQYLKEIYKASCQPQKIAPLLDRATKADTKDPAFWLQLGELYVQTLLKDTASSASDSTALGTHPTPAKTTDELKKTNDVFQKALSYGNDDPDVLEKVARFYVATQQLPDAVPLYKHVLEIDPSRNAARENLARCYIGTDQKELAITTLEDLIKADPVQSHAYEFLAKLYEDAGKFDKASAEYEQSLLITPNHPEAYDGLARLLLDRYRQPEKAIGVLTEARKRFADLPWFTFLLSIALEENKQYQPALAMFEETVAEAQNGQPGLLNSQFYRQYGETAEQAGQYDQAARLLKKALETEDDPERVAITNNDLGYMYVDHNLDVEEGGALIKKALEAEPDNGAYLDSMGWYYYRTGQFDKALAELTRAVELLKPEDQTVYGHLGDTYLKLNEVQKALGCWQKAVELDPASPDVADLNKKIADAKAMPAAATPPPATTAQASPAPKS